jgi:hypothetical protein
VGQGKAQQRGAGLDLAATLDGLVRDGQLIKVEIMWQTGQKRRKCVGMERCCVLHLPPEPIRAESRIILAPMGSRPLYRLGEDTTSTTRGHVVALPNHLTIGQSTSRHHNLVVTYPRLSVRFWTTAGKLINGNS